MTKVIEIVVFGATGSGKSHVLDLIDRALRSEYGHHVQIASHDLSCERGLGSPGDKPKVSETIFSLKERGVVSGQLVSSLKVEVDTSDIESLVSKVEALQGFTAGFRLDPLEQAIDQAVRLAGEAEGELAVKLGCHLEALLGEQWKRVTADE
jgi:energy-coupling factor transporter ATP-binding protein EcfA2